jgi:hypothetical protein
MDPSLLLGAAALAFQQTVPAAGSSSTLEWGKLLVPMISSLAALWLQSWRAQKAAAVIAGVPSQPLPPPTQTTVELRVIALEGELAVARARIAELEGSRGVGD